MVTMLRDTWMYVRRILAFFEFSVEVKNAKFAKYKGTLNKRDLQYFMHGDG